MIYTAEHYERTLDAIKDLGPGLDSRLNLIAEILINILKCLEKLHD